MKITSIETNDCDFDLTK